MPFNHFRTPDGARFTHIPSGKIFTCHRFRSHCKNALTLELSEESNNSKIVGTTTIECTYHDFFNKFIWAKNILKYPKGAFGVAMISIEPLYRSKHLGALLMLLITFEVQINKGQHLYLIEPRIGVLGFYLQLGFHPAPDDAHKHHSICHSDNLPDTHSGFAEKLNATRNQPLWRGELNLVQSLLLKKVTPSFQFHQSF